MSAAKPRLLIVDDEESICELLFESMTSYGYDCATAENAEQALALLPKQSFDLALLDIRLPGQSGISLLKQINASYPEIASIMLTAVNELDVAVESMKAGALDYITKPFELKKVNAALQAAQAKKSRPVNTPVGVEDLDIAALEAIAHGVEAHQDILDIHSEKVIQQTVEIGRKMEFPEEKIKQWIAYRSGQQSSVIKQVTTSIFKLVEEPGS
jgi:DNA-binding NtrC family response regulator